MRKLAALAICVLILGVPWASAQTSFRFVACGGSRGSSSGVETAVLPSVSDQVNGLSLLPLGKSWPAELKMWLQRKQGSFVLSATRSPKRKFELGECKSTRVSMQRYVTCRCHPPRNRRGAELEREGLLRCNSGRPLRSNLKLKFQKEDRC